jgi:hypothetical protein
MAYDKYRSATEIANTFGTISAEHDALWIGADDTGGGTGADGDLKCTFAKDTVAVTLKGITAGTLLPIEVASIDDTVTKVGSVVALESGERWST